MNFHKHRITGNPTMHPSMQASMRGGSSTTPATSALEPTAHEKIAAPESTEVHEPAAATETSTEAAEHEEEAKPQVVAKDSGSVV